MLFLSFRRLNCKVSRWAVGQRWTATHNLQGSHVRNSLFPKASSQQLVHWHPIVSNKSSSTIVRGLGSGKHHFVFPSNVEPTRHFGRQKQQRSRRSPLRRQPWQEKSTGLEKIHPARHSRSKNPRLDFNRSRKK